jgi:hypothetical protein
LALGVPVLSFSRSINDWKGTGLGLDVKSVDVAIQFRLSIDAKHIQFLLMSSFFDLPFLICFIRSSRPIQVFFLTAFRLSLIRVL